MGSAPPLPYAEKHWERSIAAPRVDDAFVRERLAPWSELVDKPWQALGGGLRTLNLRVRDDRVLRVSLTPDNDLRREAALLAGVGAEVGAPRVLGVSAGALLLEYVPHEELPASIEAAERVGRVAAIIHRRRYRESGFLDADLEVADPFPTPFDGLSGYMAGLLDGRAGRRLDSLASLVRAAWSAHAPALRAACANPSLVHGDFKPANVKWRRQQRDVVVFDWEFAWAGPALLDLGQFLRWGAPNEFVDALARSYQETGGELPAGWRRTAELLDLVNLLGFLDHGDERPVRDRDVLRRVRETLAG